MKLWPESLLARLLTVIITGVLLAQLLSSLFWVTQIREADSQSLKNLTKQVAYSVTSTASFFIKFPVQYRHLVLDQLRNMGGTRYFVTLNEERISIIDAGNERLLQPIRQTIQETIQASFGQQTSLAINISQTDNLHVLNNQTLLSDLPYRWAQDSLLIDTNSLILVIQMEINQGEWLYIAANIPAALLQDEWEVLKNNQFPLLVIMLLVMTIITFSIVKWLTQPLRMLSRAARDLGKNIDNPPIKETGAREVSEAAKAFNLMQTRIKSYIQDRATMLSAISHDLKTPITRISLQVDLIEDDELRDSIEEDLQDLTQMVKGALECLKGTDIQEDKQSIDITQFCQRLSSKYKDGGSDISVSLTIEPFQKLECKPLALKRCLTNLIDNALFYGKRAEMKVFNDEAKNLVFHIYDYGVGVPEDKLESIFAPYFRLEKSRNKNNGGIGLGLNIAQNIAQAHGGKLYLQNTENKGLRATLKIPQE